MRMSQWNVTAAALRIFIFSLIGHELRSTTASHQSANEPKLRKHDFRHIRKSHWGTNSPANLRSEAIFIAAVFPCSFSLALSLSLSQCMWLTCIAQECKWRYESSCGKRFYFRFFFLHSCSIRFGVFVAWTIRRVVLTLTVFISAILELKCCS